MRNPLARSLTAFLILASLSCSISPAQSRRHGRQIKRTKTRLTQTASKACITNDETKGCAGAAASPEPDTGPPGGKRRCSDCVSLGKPIDISAPCYPQGAKANNISGQVQVKFVIDEEGKVIWARAINGHPMLRNAAVNAACRSRFTPSTLLGSKMKVKAIGVVTYVFKLP